MHINSPRDQGLKFSMNLQAFVKLLFYSFLHLLPLQQMRLNQEQVQRLMNFFYNTFETHGYFSFL